jgi:hypothetical protein
MSSASVDLCDLVGLPVGVRLFIIGSLVSVVFAVLQLLQVRLLRSRRSRLVTTGHWIIGGGGDAIRM